MFPAKPGTPAQESGLPCPDSAAADRYIDAVRRFAARVLECGLDRFGPQPTPLLADGLDVRTLQPVQWTFGDRQEHRWLYSNQLSHHMLFRALEGLTTLTGDRAYVEAARSAVRHAFDHLRGPSGLFYWGGHTAWDLAAGRWVGLRWRPNVAASPAHEMKYHLPHYELLWSVDAEVTRTYLEAFWGAHIINWDSLDLDRHADIEAPPRLPRWEHPYPEPSVFFDGQGLTFQNVSTDLILAAVSLHLHTRQEGPLVWAHRLARRFVATRDRRTGLGGFQFSCRPPDRAMGQLGPQLPGHLVLEGTILHPVSTRMLAGTLLRLADQLGPDGEDFRRWALEDLAALARHAYDPAGRCFRRMLTDGTDLTGVPFQRDGYYGRPGQSLEPDEANMSFARVYLGAWRAGGDKLFWNTARELFRGGGMGDIGAPGGTGMALSKQPADDSPAAIHSLLDLREIVQQPAGQGACLAPACAAADRILAGRFVNDLFVDSPVSPRAQLNAREPLAMLRLATVLRGRGETVPDDPDGRRAFLAAKTKPCDPMYIHDFSRIYGHKKAY
jgi:pectate lyase